MCSNVKPLYSDLMPDQAYQSIISIATIEKPAIIFASTLLYICY